MKGIFKAALLVFLTIGVMTETGYAQRRVVVRKKRATVVVHKRPVHRVVVRKAHLHYATMPRWGTVVTVAPGAAITLSVGRHNYYYTNGIYYRHSPAGYVVARPVRGVRIAVLPAGYRTVAVGPRHYYYYFGTFYVKSSSPASEYVVVNPPEGAVVDALPEGYDIKTVDNNEYYYLDGTYFAEVEAPEFDDKVGYQIVEL